jgi:hypothetical protein
VEILEYGVKLADYMSPASKTASKSLEQLSGFLKASKKDLADQEKALLTAKSAASAYAGQLALAKSSGDMGGFTKYSALLGEQKTKIADLSEKLLGNRPISEAYIGGLEKQIEATTKAEAATTTLGEDLAALAGPVGAVLAAVTAVAVGFAALTYETAKLGIEETEAKDQLVTMFDALGDGPGAGEATIAMLDDLEGSLGQTRGKLSEWTQEFEALGITDLSGLQYQLNATGAAYAIMGDKGASAYEHLEAKIQEAIETGHGLKIADKGLAALGQTGANVNDVAAKMGITAAELRNQLKKGSVDAQAFGDALSEAIIDKGQGPLENLRNDLGTITAHAHESFLKLFDGVNAEPFKAELAGLVGILDEGQPSADALKAGITGFLDKVYEVGTEALPVIKHFFLETEILALESYIALAPTIFAFEDMNDALGPLGFSVHNVDLFFRGLIGSLQTTAKIIGFVLPALADAASLGAVSVGSGGAQFAGGGTAQGVAAGIHSGREKVSAAGADMGKAAIGGYSAETETHSPSRVGIRLGHNFGVGVAMGAQQSTRIVERASVGMGERMAESPRIAPMLAPSAGSYSAASAPEASPYASNQEGRSLTINVGGIHVEGHNKESAMEITETGVATLFERLAQQVGR